MSSDVAIRLTNITKSFNFIHHHRSIRSRALNLLSSQKEENILALQDINFEVRKGEVFGVIGRNGSGKSTLINLIMQTIRPDKGGELQVKGKPIRLALGMGVDPNLSGRDNIYLNGSILGLSFRYIGSIFEDIISFSGLSDAVDRPVKHYSKGMKQRLLFSIAMYAKADIYLLDEFFGGTGDEDFKKKSDQAFKQRILEQNTIVIVSHSLSIIKKHCNRVLWLDKGKIMMIDEPITVIKKYKDSFNQN
jgi:ABC-type polysaccharide/polyol phosphate transport system ATPase subunit